MLRALAIIGISGAALASASALPLPEVARPPTSVVRAASTADPVGAHAAIAQAQERLAEIDATITVLQEEADKASGEIRQREQNALAGLRAVRDTYRKELDGVVAQGRQMTADQLAAARAALEAPWTQFEHDLDRDVAALKLDASARKAVIEARVRAEQAYWQKVIAELQASATDLTAEQVAAIEARIARIRARADEARARLTRLGTASQSAWTALKKGFIHSRDVFEESYRGGQ